MPKNDEITSLDTLRDLDTEDRSDRLDSSRPSVYHIYVTEVYEVNARSTEEALERWNNDEAIFLGDVTTEARKVDD